MSTPFRFVEIRDPDPAFWSKQQTSAIRPSIIYKSHSNLDVLRSPVETFFRSFIAHANVQAVEVSIDAWRCSGHVQW